MKTIDGKKYLRIGEVADRVNRTTSTIKNWYKWAKEKDKLDLLPEVIRVGSRRDRYFLESDMEQLEKFADSIEYGSMSDFNQRMWGDRKIESKRSVDFEMK